jgi:hypothetical protein
MQIGPVGDSKKTSDYAEKYKISKLISGPAAGFIGVGILTVFYIGEMSENKKWIAFFITAISTFVYWLALRYQFKKYHACPCCDKMYVVKYDWQCDYCHETQGEERLIIHPCNKCGRKLELFTCQHCEEEFKLYADKS